MRIAPLADVKARLSAYLDECVQHATGATSLRDRRGAR